jgi:hypothetical protein
MTIHLLRILPFFSLFMATLALGGAILAASNLQTIKRTYMPRPNHWPKDKHFTGTTLDNQKFLYCPVGNIVSWSVGDYDNKYCHFERKYFSELNQ